MTTIVHCASCHQPTRTLYPYTGPLCAWCGAPLCTHCNQPPGPCLHTEQEPVNDHEGGLLAL